MTDSEFTALFALIGILATFIAAAVVACMVLHCIGRVLLAAARALVTWHARRRVRVMQRRWDEAEQQWGRVQLAK